MKETIVELSTWVAPSGFERDLVQHLLHPLRDIADDVFVDTLGNGIATKSGDGPHVLLVAHADEPGVMVVDIDNDGFLRLISIGQLPPYTLVGRHVQFTNGTVGVIGSELQGSPSDLGFEHLYVDIGCRDLTSASERAAIGLAGVVIETTQEVGSQRLSGRALDNRVGCAIAASAFTTLAQENKHVSVLFTAQGEVGSRGAKTAAFRVMPDLAMVIDACPCQDGPADTRPAVQLGKGPAIKVMDSNVIVPHAVKQHLEATASRLSIVPQHEVSPKTTTDGGVIQRARRGVLVGGISYPARFVGGPSQLVDMHDVDQTLQFVIEAVRSYA